MKPGNARRTALAVIIVTALGIFAVAVTLSTYEAVVRGAAPFPNPSRLVNVMGPAFRGQHFGLNTKEANILLHAGGMPFGSAAYSSFGGAPTRLANGKLAVPMGVTPQFLHVFGIVPVRGSGFLPSDFAPGAAPVAMVSYQFWQHTLGARADLVGQAITIGKTSYTLRGILPGNTPLAGLGGLYVPETAANMHDGNTVFFYARLRQGESLTAAQAALDGIAGQHQSALTNVFEKNFRYTAIPYIDSMLGPVKGWLEALVLAALLALGLACANAANLLLARASARESEMATRMALGAGRGRLIGAVVGESAALSLAGCAVGLAFAPLGMQFARSFALPAAAQHVAQFQAAPIGFTGYVLMACVGLALVSATLAALGPALHAAHVEPARLLQAADGGFVSSAGHRHFCLARGLAWLRRATRLTLGRAGDPWSPNPAGSPAFSARWALIGVQVALAVCLACTAGLLAMSLQRQTQMKLGFQPAGLTAALLSVNPKPAQLLGLLQHVAAVPGVTSVTVTGNPPFTARHGVSFLFGYRQLTGTWKRSPGVPAQGVSAGYFHTLETKLVAGRAFRSSDTAAAPEVVIVNQSLAAMLWPGGKAIGQQLAMDWPNTQKDLMRVVGIAPDLADGPGAAARVQPEIYFPYRQQQDAVAWFGFYLLYRNAPERPATAASVSTAVARALPGTKIIRTLSIEQALAASWFLPRFRSLLAAGFFALALLIALFGIYAAVGEDLGRRRRELGIRGALGADPSRLAALAVSGVALAAAAGAAVGIGGAVWLSQLLQSAIHLSATSGASAYAAAAVLCWLAAVAVAAVAALPLVRRSPGDLLASR